MIGNLFLCTFYLSSQYPQVKRQFIATQSRSHLSWFSFFWHLAADQLSWHNSSPDPPLHNSQVKRQFLATLFLLHFPLFFLLWHFLVGQISSQTSPIVVVVVVVVVEEPVGKRRLSQCGNFMIFLSLIFYVKSKLGIL